MTQIFRVAINLVIIIMVVPYCTRKNQDDNVIVSTEKFAKEQTEEDNMVISIIEKKQREDLNPIEEAEALQQMIMKFGLNQEQVSKSVGKSRPYITNSLRLLKLPKVLQDYVIDGKLTNGHARAIAGVHDLKTQLFIAEKVIEEG